jgi:hypothetical protein
MEEEGDEEEACIVHLLGVTFIFKLSLYAVT